MLPKTPEFYPFSGRGQRWGISTPWCSTAVSRCVEGMSNPPGNIPLNPDVSLPANRLHPRAETPEIGKVVRSGLETLSTQAEAALKRGNDQVPRIFTGTRVVSRIHYRTLSGSRENAPGMG